MVNQNIQGVVPIDGAGFKAIPKRSYKPGEYRRLVNCELRDGHIKPRRNITACGSRGDTIEPIVNPYPFIGFYKDYVIVANETEQWATNGAGGYDALWPPTSLAAGSGANGFHKLVGVFVYNDKIYWISNKFDSDTGHHRIYLHYVDDDPFVSIFDIVFGDLTTVEIILHDEAFEEFIFCNFFVQGEPFDSNPPYREQGI